MWKRIRYRLEWLAIVALFKAVPLLSRRACYQFAGWAGRMMVRFDRRGRDVSFANLEAAFGNQFSPPERERIVCESYEHFARTMLDLFWSPRLNAQNFRDYIEFEGVERSAADVARYSNSCVVGTFHYSNFEWLGLATAWLGYPCDITTQEFKNPLLDRFFEKLREQSGHTVVPREGAIIRLYKTLRRKGRVALLVDTTLPPQQPTVVIECFGLKTIVTVAHAWLQERTGVPLIPIYCEPLPDGRYRVVTLPTVHMQEGATHQQIAQACWDVFEPVVRRNPAPWLWMYKHWRYKPAEASHAYPFYAQESLAFEQVAERTDYVKLDQKELPAPAPIPPEALASRSPWKQARHRLEHLAVRCAAFLLPLLPREFAHRLAETAGWMAAHFDREGRSVSLSNVEVAFGDRFSPAERTQLVNESYRHFSRAIGDLYWSPRLTPETLPQIFEFEGLERTKAECGQRGIIFACLHYSGFEWIPRALSLSGFDCTVVIQAFKNPLLTPIITELREGHGHQTVFKEGALLRLYKALRAGRSVALAVDLTISPRMPSVPIVSFGMMKSVTFAHAWLHRRTGAPIVPTHCEPLEHNRYRLVLHPPLQISAHDSNRQIVQACWDRFEPMIAQNPAPWIWMYKHWRYRPPNASRVYPDYANESPHFRKLLEQAEREKLAAAPAAEAFAG